MQGKGRDYGSDGGQQKKGKVMEHREEVRYEVSKQFQLSKSDPLVGCNSSSGI